MTTSPEAPTGWTADVVVRAGNWDPPEHLRDLAAAAVATTEAAVPPSLRGPAELAVVFTDDAEIAGLNARFRGHAGATNVLSFPAPRVPGGVRLLGDIVLGQETISREAAGRGLTMDHHITHLLVHGLLHLAGYDHADDAEAQEMERMEAAILARLGIADPHAQGALPAAGSGGTDTVT